MESFLVFNNLVVQYLVSRFSRFDLNFVSIPKDQM